MAALAARRKRGRPRRTVAARCAVLGAAGAVETLSVNNSSSTSARTRLPRYKRAEQAPAMRLTERDQQIVAWVSELRFTTQEQIRQLLFTPQTASSCRHRLTLLYHNRYLDRRLIPLRSRFGANRAVYCLDKRGA